MSLFYCFVFVKSILLLDLNENFMLIYDIYKFWSYIQRQKQLGPFTKKTPRKIIGKISRLYLTKYCEWSQHSSSNKTSNNRFTHWNISRIQQILIVLTLIINKFQPICSHHSITNRYRQVALVNKPNTFLLTQYYNLNLTLPTLDRSTRIHNTMFFYTTKNLGTIVS